MATVYEYSIKGIVQALVDLIAASGGGPGGPGATQYDEDSPSTGGEKLTLAGIVRQDTISPSTSNDGDYGYLKSDASGSLYVNTTGSTITANQGGSWTVAATQSGSWTAAATQSGTWTVRNQDALGNNLLALTSAPTGTERGLVVRNIPSGTQTISGIVDAVQSGAWTVAATQSGAWSVGQTGTWSVRTQDNAGNGLESLTGSPAGTERGLIVRNIPSGVQTVSGSVNASQSGGWTVAATQSGGWTTAATQSGGWSVGQTGTWSVRNQDNAGNGLESLTTSPVGTERGLIVRNIPSGTQAIAGAVTQTNATTNYRQIGTLPGNAKASAGVLFSLSCTNLNAATRYLQIFNSAGAPSGTPLESYPVYANAGVLFLDDAFFGPEGLAFSTGITFGFSTTPLTYTAGVGTDCILIARYT